jgi:hypothetical protein
VPLHPTDDRSPDAVPVILHRIRVEALAPVPYEDADLLRFHLGIERDRAHPGVPGGVDQRLAGRGDQRADPLVGLPVAHHHRLDGDREGVLHLGGGLLQGGGEPFRGRAGRPVEPVPQ